MNQIKTTEEYIERNINNFLNLANKDLTFGTSYVQRLCKIGFNQACYTVAEMLDREIITVEDVNGLNIKYIFKDV